jgi:hypothetical protein
LLQALWQLTLLLNYAILLFLLLLALLDEFSLDRVGFGMYLRVDPRVLTERVIIVHELSTSLLIETRLWEWYDKQAPDNFENVLERPLGGGPISLQSVDADFTRVNSNIWMENLCHKESFWCTLREPIFDDKFATENSTFISSLY